MEANRKTCLLSTCNDDRKANEDEFYMVCCQLLARPVEDHIGNIAR